MAINCASACRRALSSLSTPLDVELCPEAELTPLVVERVDIVLAALDPTFPDSHPMFANGRREFRMAASAF